MPRTSAPIWYWTLLLLVSLPGMNLVYRFASSQAGVPRTADSSGATDTVALTAIALGYAPILLGITWFCVRRYNPETRLLAWRRDRPERSFVVTLLFGGLAAFCVYLIIVGLSDDEPWYEKIPVGLFVLFIPWLLMLRAALIEQASAPSAPPERDPLTLAMALLALIICLIGAAAVWILLMFGTVIPVAAMMGINDDPTVGAYIDEQLSWFWVGTGLRLAVLLIFGSGAFAAYRLTKIPGVRPLPAAILLLLALSAIAVFSAWPPIYY